MSLAVGGTRDYAWGAAGHLEEVAAGANVFDFGADDAGRPSGVYFNVRRWYQLGTGRHPA